MFAGLTARVARFAEARARARRDALAERLAEALPKGLRAEAEAGGVRLAGKDLRRRIASDASLRALIAGLAR